MKSLLLAVLAAGMLLLAAGCSTPAYSGGCATIKFPEEKASGENANHIARAWYWDSKEIGDDVNSLMLLDSPSRLSKWNIR